MSSRSLTDLHQSIYPKAEAFLVECERRKIVVLVTCTLRGNDEQTALYAQGRLPMDQVNTLRIHAGLPPLSEYENRLHVTNAKAGESAHQYGLALDVVPLVGGKCVWETSSPVWKDIVAIAESVGLESASKWKTFKEWPHLQYLGGLSIDDLRNGKRPV